VENTNKKKIAVALHPRAQLGLGDIFIAIYRKNGWFSKLKAMSNDYKIYLLVCCHNSHSFGLFKYFDYLEPVRVGWNGNHPNYKRIAENIGARFVGDAFVYESRHEIEDPTMQLSPEEQDTYNEISKNGIILIHPFAGEKQRIPIKPQRYTRLIRGIREHTDGNIVVVGGSFRRNKRKQSIPAVDVKEDFTTNISPNVFNLVNKTTPRLAAKLTEKANFFFGTWSAYCCIAWEKKIPIAMFVGPDAYKEFMGRRKNSYFWHKEILPVDAKTQTEDKAFSDGINFFKKVTRS